ATLGDVRLELRQRRRRVGAVEAADGHDRVAGRELNPGRAVGAHGRGDPVVGRGVLLQQRDQVGARVPGVEQPAEPARSATAEAAPHAAVAAALAGEAPEPLTALTARDPLTAREPLTALPAGEALPALEPLPALAVRPARAEAARTTARSAEAAALH